MRRTHPLFARIYRLAAILARPTVPYVVLPLMAVMLAGGTVSQRYIGLYESQRIFFTSLPALALLGLLTVSLICKFLFFSPWRMDRFGINLAHLGILVLLIGGFLTALQAQEGSMVIGEKESSAIVRDYHDREFSIVEGDVRQVIPFTRLKPGYRIPLADGKGEIEILSACRSCAIERVPDGGVGAEAESLRGMAKFMRLSPGKPALKDEENITGVAFSFKTDDAAQGGRYILFDPMPKPLDLSAGGRHFSLLVEKRQRDLPFSLFLDDFRASNHPGTAMARAYHSDVTVKDGAVEWPVRIEMNKPLRYKGYTFFQSSFFRPGDGGKEYTVLAVVQNGAWLFPYIGTGLMAFGLLAHICIVLGLRRQRRGRG